MSMGQDSAITDSKSVDALAGVQLSFIGCGVMAEAELSHSALGAALGG